ncbi:MAG TPA: 50S ribosomal protein L15 [Spirochaetota bacterium]|nr:50S ribosomal protein L15 [Spirochaetota bacterium]
MEQYTIKKPDSIKRKKRIGIGPSSGHGKTSCRGHKGQMSRSGSTHRAWFEGGQMPLQRRIPKRGFNNVFKKEYQIVNISVFEKLEITEITPEFLEKKGYIEDRNKLVKILAKGECTKAVKITADHFSATAAAKVKKAGGEVILRKKDKPKQTKKKIKK